MVSPWQDGTNRKMNDGIDILETSICMNIRGVESIFCPDVHAGTLARTLTKNNGSACLAEKSPDHGYSVRRIPTIIINQDNTPT